MNSFLVLLLTSLLIYVDTFLQNLKLINFIGHYFQILKIEYLLNLITTHCDLNLVFWGLLTLSS